jgi:lambda family phage minor tail protein L
MTTPALEATAQSLTPGEIVELFRLDTGSYGGPILYFTQAKFETEAIRFGGVTYEPVDVEFKGFETSGVGSLPTPSISVANTGGVIQSIINTYGDLLGCDFRRVRTFRRFLDGQPAADPAAYFGPDIFRVERKTNENAEFIEWELSAAIDQEGKQLPGRLVLRDICLWRYRRYDAASGGFDYSNAQCPYAGAIYYDESGNETTIDKDRCGRRLSHCRQRFGARAVLPYGGFPSASRKMA